MSEFKLPISKCFDGYDSCGEYLIKNYIYENTINLIYGKSNSFKSFLSVSLGCHIATGINWNGCKVKKTGVLYIVGEGGNGLSKRVKSWCDVYNHGSQINNFWRVDAPVFVSEESDFLKLISDIKTINDEFKEEIKFIVIDTLARCFGDGNENRSHDMSKYIKACDLLKRETGAAILLIHHTGKDQSRGARGSTALQAAVDAEFLVNRFDDLSLILTCSKMKDTVEPAVQKFNLREMELFEDNDQQIVTSLCLVDNGDDIRDYNVVSKNRQSQTKAAILFGIISGLVNEQGYCQKNVVLQAMKSSGYPQKNFSRWLNELESRQIISVDGDIISIKA